MRRIATLSFLLLISLSAFAQSNGAQAIGMRYFNTMADEWQLKSQDYQDVIISDLYKTKHNGVTHIYFTQQYQGIAVDNAITNMNITKDGNVAFATNQFVSDIASKVNTTTPGISASEALISVARELGATDLTLPSVKERVGYTKVIFEKANFSHNNIPVQLKYQVLKDGTVALVWDIAIDITGSADYWSVRADAQTGEILSQRNWTVYCKFEQGGIKSHNHNCGAHKIASQNQRSTVNSQVSGSYNVYPFPAESPLEATQQLVVNPHLVEASPLGWHDTDGMEGAETTITRGNNVYAYLDADADDNVPDLGSEPDGGAELVFDFAHAVDAEPEDSKDAAITNLFYANNYIHDFSYLAGFDEAAGNFQENNYGNEGAGGDNVLAEAQDGTGTDNANFATPGDGNSGRMQMFLWANDGGGNATINSPAEIAGVITQSGTGDFGLSIEGADVTGEAAIAFNDGESMTDGCTEIINSEEVNGRIALIDRGFCFFSQKAEMAEAAGAIGVLICNVPGVNGGTGEEVLNMTAADDAGPIGIPVLFLQTSVCNVIKASLNAGVPVEVNMKQIDNEGPTRWDASFDNGVMAHEYGHGISNRLTGGPSAAGCLGNDEQMGEGWSDFFTLVTTTKVGAQGTDNRAIGNYVASQGTNGRGIRSQPYTTDKAFNNKTYDNIKGTTAPHPLGEVWAASLWDVYWGFVDLYGFDADLTNTESGNFKAIQLVMDGMKFQSCSPGFIAGRNAILAADVVNHDGIHECMLWDIFASRGVGFNADGGSTDDRNDGTENFESKPQCITELKIAKQVTELVQADNEIEVTLTVTNHFPQTVNNLVVTDEIPGDATFVDGSASMTGTVMGSNMVFNIASMEYDDVITITYKLKAGSQKSTTLVFNDVEDDIETFWSVDLTGTDSPWIPSTTNPRSGSLSWYVQETEADADQRLLFGPFTVSGAVPVFRFWHDIRTQQSFDGGFVEISNDGGTSWTRVDDKFIKGGYEGPLAYDAIPIPSLQAFSGNSGGYVDAYIDLSAYSGQSVSMRFRYGSDATIISPATDPGWFIDDAELMDLLILTSTACVAADETSSCSNEATTIIDSDNVVAVVDAEPDFFEMSLFPNPTQDQVNISIAAKQVANGTLSISSIDGKVIINEKIGINQVLQTKSYNLKSLSSGLYIVKIETELGTITKKLTIQ